MQVSNILTYNYIFRLSLLQVRKCSIIRLIILINVIYKSEALRIFGHGRFLVGKHLQLTTLLCLAILIIIAVYLI